MDVTSDPGFIDVHEQLALSLDGTRAGTAFDEFVGAHPPDGGTDARLRLKAPVWLPNLGAEIELRGDVIATFFPVRAKPAGATACATVTWYGGVDAPFPRLHGHLWVTPATADTSWLRFDGRYRRMPSTVRLAAPGESVIGHRIVLATARLLLREVAGALRR